MRKTKEVALGVEVVRQSRKSINKVSLSIETAPAEMGKAFKDLRSMLDSVEMGEGADASDGAIRDMAQ